MAIEIGGQGMVGLAFETTVGTYVAPTKWVPIRSESLQKIEDKQWRTNIRGIADRTKGPQGNTRVEGDVEFEVTRENLLYFLYTGRWTITKSGVGPFTYTFVNSHAAKPTTGSGPTARKTLSILTARGSRPFGYTGLVAGQYAFSFDNETLICTVSLMGLEEAQQTIPAATWPTSEPYGGGQNSVKIPTATSRTDINSFTLTVNDNLSAEHRMDGLRTPAFVRFGEREVTASMEHDFDALTDYNAFINATEQEITLLASRSATNDQLSVVLEATLAESYQVNLTSLGDLVTASSSYHAFYGTQEPVTIEVKTTEDIT